MSPAAAQVPDLLLAVSGITELLSEMKAVDAGTDSNAAAGHNRTRVAHGRYLPASHAGATPAGAVSVPHPP